MNNNFEGKATKTIAASTIAVALLTGLPNAAHAWGKKSEPAEADRAYSQLEQDFSSSQEKYKALAKRLEKTIAEAQTRFKTLGTEKSELESQIDETQQTVTRLRLEREKHEQALDEQERLMTQLQSRLEELTSELPTYETAIHAAKRAKELEAKLEVLKVKYKKSQDERKDIAAKALQAVNELETALTEKTKRIEGLEKTTREACSRAVKAETTLAKQSETRKEHQETIHALRSQLAEWTSDLAAAKKSADEARRSEAQLQKAMQGSQVTIASLSSKLEETVDAAEKLARLHQESKSKTGHLESELNDERHEREALEAIVAQQDRELREAKQKLAEATKEKNEAVADAQDSFDLLESFLLRQEKLMIDLERARKSVSTPAT